MSNSTPPGWYRAGDGREYRRAAVEATVERPRAVRFAPSDEATRVRPRGPRPMLPAPPAPLLAPPLAPPVGPAGPAPGRRRAGWLAVAVAAGVLTVVLAVTAGALAVLRPWTEGPAGDGRAGTGPGTGPAAVQGDLDGDGHGDAVYYLSPGDDTTSRVTATSDGSAFTTTALAVEEPPGPGELHLDWDGDGAHEQLSWRFVEEPGRLTLSSTDGEFPGDQTFALAASSPRGYGIEVRVQPGDFDGDGSIDLAVAAPRDRAVEVHVLLGDGAGGFAEPEVWASVPNAIVDVTEVRVGDVDGDGDADLWLRLPAERLTDREYATYYTGKHGYALLSSTGERFDVGAVFENALAADALLLGDVLGDGTASLVTVETSASDGTVQVRVHDLADGQPREIAGFTGMSTIGRRSLQDATLSDVDGDGRADVVFVVRAHKESKFTGVQVMRSTGIVFEGATVWADTPPCAGAECRIEFAGP